MSSAGIMRSEILEQPLIAANLLVRERRGLESLVVQLKRKKPVGIVLAARGSSDHAATYARYLLEYLLGIPTQLAAPSLVSIYGAKPHLKDYLVIGVSQSGEGPDINSVIKAAAKSGALTLGVTNNPKIRLGQGGVACPGFRRRQRRGRGRHQDF